MRGEREGGDTRDRVSVLFEAPAAIHGAAALRPDNLAITRKGGNSIHTKETGVQDGSCTCVVPEGSRLIGLMVCKLHRWLITMYVCVNCT